MTANAKETRGRATRVAIVGAGFISDYHLAALRRLPATEIVAVCDVNESRAKALAARIPGARAFKSVREMAEQQPVDAAHVLVPAEYHQQVALALIDADVNVLMEKPIATTASAATTIAEAASSRRVRVGVSHNFLFSPVYEQMRADVTRGTFGPIDHLEVVWSRELPQVRCGPFGTWLFADAGNVLREVGPHLVTQVVDLLGEPTLSHVEADLPIDLPNGTRFYQRWTILGRCGTAMFTLRCNFGPVCEEQVTLVHGRTGSARADFVGGLYVADAPSRFDDYLDRYVRARRSASRLRTQARHVLTDYVKSKAKIGGADNPYAHSILRSVQAFHAPGNGSVDPRLDAHFATRALAICEAIADEGLSRAGAGPMKPVTAAPPPRDTCDVLVVGGNGFIGQHLVDFLCRGGQHVRVLSRSGGGFASDPNHAVEYRRGDLCCEEDVARAVDGARTVFHLARATAAETWADYLAHDVEPTRRLARACAEAGVKRLVYTGSIDSLYTARVGAIVTEADGVDRQIARRNLYARAKAMGEQVLLDIHRGAGLDVVIVRPGIVLGIGGCPFHWGVGHWQRNSVVSLWGNGLTPLPLVLVDDVAAALMSAASAADIAGETFNLVAQSDITARQYVDALGSALKTDFQMVPVPLWKHYAGDMAKWVVKCAVRHPSRRQPSYRDWASRAHRSAIASQKAKSLLSWRPTEDREALIGAGITEPALWWMR